MNGEGRPDRDNMRTCTARSIRAILAAILVALPAAVFAAGVSSQDKALLAAHDAFKSGDGFKLAGYVEKIRGHALESYLAFWGSATATGGGRSGGIAGFSGPERRDRSCRADAPGLASRSGQKRTMGSVPAGVSLARQGGFRSRLLCASGTVAAAGRLRLRRDPPPLEIPEGASFRLRAGGRCDAAIRGSHGAGPARPLPNSRPGRSPGGGPADRREAACGSGPGGLSDR